MAAKQLTDEQLREAQEAVKKYGSVTEAAKALGLNRTTLSCRLSKATGFPEQEKNRSQESRDLESSGLKAENSRLKNHIAELQSGGKRLPVESNMPPSPDVSAMWALAEEDNARRIVEAKERARFSVTLPEHRPCLISFVSDQHIAPGTPVDMRRMREDAELIAKTDGCYAVLGGDGVDNHIKHRSAILAARSQPGDQWQLFDYYLSIFNEKIIALISGNHDLWSNQIAGIDMMSWIAKQRRLCYAPDEAFIQCKLGDITYRLAVRHQYRFNSSFNLLHSVKRWWEMGEEDFDIGCICHNHAPGVEPFIKHGLERWGCRPGAYQITSAYSRQFGYNRTVPRCPSFLVFPDERRIVGFADVWDAVKTLKAER